MSVLRRMQPKEIIEFFEEEEIKQCFETMKKQSWYKVYMEKLLEKYCQFVFTLFQLAEEDEIEAMRIFPRESLKMSAETYLISAMALRANDDTIESAKIKVKEFLNDEEFICRNLERWFVIELGEVLNM